MTATSFVGCGSLYAQQYDRPNIIVFIVDDMGWQDTSLPFWDKKTKYNEMYTPIRDKIAISCMLRQIHEFSSHAIRHGLYIKNRKRLFCP